MRSALRARMVEGAAVLLARQGVQATSFGEVLKLTGASRGSIYHHFPGGKTQLVGEAVDLLGARAFDPIEQHAGASAEEITRAFLRLWRSFIDEAGLSGGCGLLTVTVTADSAELIDRTAAVFARWRARLAALLAQGGLAPADARGFAAALLAGVEGALVLARSQRSMEPFDLVAVQLLDQARRLAARVPLRGMAGQGPGQPRPQPVGRRAGQVG